MKILQINAIYGYGSTGRICLELQNYINSGGRDECYTAFSQGVPVVNTYQIGSCIDRKVHGLCSRFFGKQAHHSRLATKHLLRYMDEIRPDVVLLHNLHGNYIHLPMLLQYLATNDIATIIILHDCWFYTGKCTHYTVDQCTKWKIGCQQCPRLQKDNPSWYLDRTRELWKEKKELFSTIPRLGVVGVSDWITGEAKRSLLGCARHIERIYNWIDLDTFIPKQSRERIEQRLNLQGKKVVLGVASGWSDSKGLSNFIQLATNLGNDYAFVLVGRKPALQNIPENLFLAGSTSSVDELADYYSAADVFVTLSLEESFGKVSAEALACGTPVVCFDSTANKELVGPGCGTVVAPGDMEGIKAAVESICKQNKDAFSHSCRNYAEANFSMKERLQDYLRVIETVVGR